MNTYIILRRSGWSAPQELQEAAARSEATGEDMAGEIRWIRSYVMDENSGVLGTVCVYQATDPEAIRRHAEIALLPVDEIIPVMDTVVKRPDPQ
jgi:hypothetical protein